MKRAFALLLLFMGLQYQSLAADLHDDNRNRQIPVELYYPENEQQCSSQTQCPVVLLSAGYGVKHNKYQFIARELTKQGYLTVAIAHELPGDPALSVSGDLYQTRQENWKRGAVTLSFVQQKLRQQLTAYDFEHLTLIGHSNGGDISAWLTREKPDYIQNLITLDHRRVPLPRDQHIKVLSIRASDFAADKGVLPAGEEAHDFPICVKEIKNARHNDMSDYGPDWLQQRINLLLRDFLMGKACSG